MDRVVYRRTLLTWMLVCSVSLRIEVDSFVSNLNNGDTHSSKFLSSHFAGYCTRQPVALFSVRDKKVDDLIGSSSHSFDGMSKDVTNISTRESAILEGNTQKSSHGTGIVGFPRLEDAAPLSAATTDMIEEEVNVTSVVTEEKSVGDKETEVSAEKEKVLTTVVDIDENEGSSGSAIAASESVDDHESNDLNQAKSNLMPGSAEGGERSEADEVASVASGEVVVAVSGVLDKKEDGNETKYVAVEVARTDVLLGDEDDAVTELEEAISEAADAAVEALTDDTCEVDEETGLPADPEVCADESTLQRAKSKLKNIIGNTLSVLKSGGDDVQVKEDEEDEDEEVLEGEILEKGWEKRGNSSALRRNAEVWKFALRCVFRALKPRKLRKKGASEEEIKRATTEAAEFIRDGLLKLGPTFVKLGQVVSTRTDVLPLEYTEVLKTLQDDVPGFSGRRAKAIITAELGKPCDSVFKNFSLKPMAAASLGQVHTARYKGKKVAIKVQRAGLKDLFDVDLKNLKKLAELLEKFDPKTDGADRDWVSIYEESERLLYLEIDYINEAKNAERFARDFMDTSYVRVPEVFLEVSTPRVLTMEFVESFKLTDLENVDRLGLDRKLLAKRTADAFLKQIIETSYFHCDPHPGNLCVDSDGNLVYYDFGMMDELKPNVRSGFRKFCTALFAGGPAISDADLAKNAKLLVDGVEEAGVLAKGADRLAVEKLARYFMRSFKDRQLGKTTANIKETLGTDLQTLTENNVFRFPSTFTFIFRAFASVDGIGKGLDKEYDIGKLAQPFVEKFTDAQQYSSQTQKRFNIFSKATGLNPADINTAVTSPKKIAYIEETMRAMEEGNLKVRVRSLENEKALERMELTQRRMENILLLSVMLNVAGLAGPILTAAGVVGAGFFGLQAFVANNKLKKFDKTQAKFVSTSFEGEK